MIKANISPEESVLQNLEAWCFEVGSRFEQASVQAARDFADMGPGPGTVCDLGSGDGAATRELVGLGFDVHAVDVNGTKLGHISELATTHETDAVNYLTENAVDNVFAHHSLEHMVDVERVLQLISQSLKPGGLYYAIVPAGDHLHSVHHVVFESHEELLPAGLALIVGREQERFCEREFVCVARKF